jgi:hypothetical protein
MLMDTGLQGKWKESQQCMSDRKQFSDQDDGIDVEIKVG